MLNAIHRFFHHFAIPSHRNNYRAKGLHLDVLTGLLVFVIGLSMFTSAHKGKILGFATDITVDKVYQYTNEVRTSHGLPPLKYNSLLAIAAERKAQDMFANNYWAHFSPQGKSPWSFIVGAGYRYEFAGENLAQGFLFSKSVVEAWMQSPTHAANVLKPDYDEVGYAVVNGNLQGEDTTLVVQMFGKQISQSNPIVGVAQAQELNPTPIPTSATTPAPTAEVTTAVATPPVGHEIRNTILTQNQITDPLNFQNSVMNIDKFNLNTSFIIFSVLLLIIVLDFYFAYRHGYVRLHGKNTAHFIFISIILIGVFIITNGLIL